MAQVTKSVISAVTLMDDEELRREVLDVTGEDQNVLDILEIVGNYKQTDEPEYNAFSNAYRFKSATIDTGGIDVTKDGQAGQTILIDVTDAADLPVKGEIAMFPSMSAGLAEVVAVGVADGLTSVQFEAKALDCADASSPAGSGVGDYEINPSGTTIAAGDVVVFPTAAYEEGSDAPDGKRPSWKRTENNIQIFKTAGEVTDIQKVSALKVNYGGSPHIYYKIQHDTYMTHRDKMAYAFLIGRKAKTVNNDLTSYKTQGLINYIKSGDGTVNTTGGIELNLSGSAVTKANFRTVSRQLDKRGAPDEYWLWAGGDFVDDMEDNIHTDGSTLWVGGSGAISYNSFGRGNGQQRAIDLGIDSFRMGGRTWHLKKLKAFDHPEIFSASTDYKYGGLAMAIPTGMIKSDLSGGMSSRLCVRYMSADGTDLRSLETLEGSLAPTPTSAKAHLKVSYETVAGLEALGIDHFAIFNE